MTAGTDPVLVPPAGSGTWRRDQVLAALQEAGVRPVAAVPVRLGRWDADSQYARWRSGWAPWRDRLAVAALAGSAVLLAVWGATGSAAVLVVALQLGAGAAAAPLLRAPAGEPAGRGPAAAGAVLFLGGLGAVAARSGAATAAALGAVQAAVQLLPLGAIGWLLGARLLGGERPGSEAAAFRAVLATPATPLRTVPARWLLHLPGGALAVALQEQEWTARGARSHLVLREPAGWTATGLRGARRLFAWTVVRFADGSEAAVRAPHPDGSGMRG